MSGSVRPSPWPWTDTSGRGRVAIGLGGQAETDTTGEADWDTAPRGPGRAADTAADTLWFRFGARFYTSYFPRIGLASAQYVSAPGITPPYWGEMLCSAAYLSRVIGYVLDDMPAPLRRYLVTTLSHVATDQHFGVWGAGSANHPGNKDGWSVEQPGWIINSVGFAGPRQRYTLAMMNSLNGHGGYHAGTETVTQVAAILFRGHQVQAPKVSASPDSIRNDRVGASRVRPPMRKNAGSPSESDTTGAESSRSSRSWSSRTSRATWSAGCC